jgi:hypothetical protein
MKRLIFVGLPIALAWSPALSATYSVIGSATGLPEDYRTSGAPESITGGDNGTTFTANATNVNHGTVSVFASEGIADVPDYNDTESAHPTGIKGGGFGVVEYTMQVMGPTTGALVPVHMILNASVGSLDIPPPVGGAKGYYAPVVASAVSEVTVEYAQGAAPIGAPESLASALATNYYDYRFANTGLLGNSDTFNQEVLVAAGSDLVVYVSASASTEFAGSTAMYTQTAEASAAADPTFTIDEPGYSAYSIVGVPAGPVATPEPATWAMMLIGFAGLGYSGYRTRRRIDTAAAKRLRSECSLLIGHSH